MKLKDILPLIPDDQYFEVCLFIETKFIQWVYSTEIGDYLECEVDAILVGSEDRTLFVHIQEIRPKEKLMHIDRFFTTVDYDKYETEWASSTFGIKVTREEYYAIRNCRPEQFQSNMRHENVMAIGMLLNYLRFGVK